ncbi:sugar ABC transporter permease [Paenibacillus macerans]|uniref:ABC transporter permease subunit n=1 Tax=Paenibacillus macerans TaxID=44252 RepID=A0A090ZDQ6_PAEMA|nr:sugar ABC transporter permease [Paenibacillus macerans]KFN08355.1 binding--dependent transport system inner membrane component family protein [Paenibacillus macerans]MCY7557601.1 sugar ABC transporter permease [Paenibacillus macerans]MEC0137492.1 sugar ABC transporter permease [Paenibacillus macerans]MEC0152285.1 sugar ABC transporter permease [Paenibacillus macerans]MEC0329195.1 sugar ABC transporter permease [Paenibacillus macerans]
METISSRSGNRLRNKRYTKRRDLYGWLFAMPAILGLLIFTLGPMIYSLYMSFTDYTGSNSPTFTGLDNYRRMFSGEDQYFYKSLAVTFYFVILSVPTGIIYSFLLAILLNQNVKGKAVFRTIFYLPSIVPIIAISFIWLWLLNPDLGLANELLRSLGLPGSQWIFGEKTVVPSLALMNLWTTGGTMIIFLAGLQDIPRSLYEAIEMDGGTRLDKLRHITIPLMTPTIFFNLIMGIINGFQVFSQAYVMTNGGPNNASLFYVFYLYREAFQFSRMGSASAIAWVLFAIIMILTYVVFRTSNKWVYYEGDGAR